MPNKSIRLIQITDMHLFASPDETLLGCHSYKSYQAVLDLIKKQEAHFDFFILTGDLSQDQTPESYQHVVNTLKPFQKPIYWIPGNHDSRDVMIEALSSFNKDKHLILNNWLMIFIDSLDDGKVPGYVSHAELERIKSLVEQYPQYYLALFIHHPPFKVHSAWIDNLCLKNQDDLFKIVDPHPHLKLIVSGHIHQEINAFYDQLLFLSCPSSSIQFKSFSDEFALDRRPPGYRWIDLHANGSILTGVCRVENYQDDIDYNSKGY